MYKQLSVEELGLVTGRGQYQVNCEWTESSPPIALSVVNGFIMGTATGASLCMSGIDQGVPKRNWRIALCAIVGGGVFASLNAIQATTGVPTYYCKPV